MEKTIIFNKKDYKDYRDMYHDISIKLDKDRFIDWQDDYEYLHYHADILNEFLWYCHNDNIHIIFLNFDKEKIAASKKYDDYEYNLILEVFEEFVKKYPNNSLEYKNKD